MSEIVQFPKPSSAEEPPELLVGPFEEWRVKIEDRIIPKLTGFRQSDGRITLIVDKRWMADFPPEYAHQVAWLIAQALAIGEGYSHLGASNKGYPFAPVGCALDQPPAD